MLKSPICTEYWKYKQTESHQLQENHRVSLCCSAAVMETYLSVCDNLEDWGFGRGGCGVAKVNGRRGLELTGEFWTEP